MSCQICRVDASTKRVVFYQNIGAVFLRFSKTLDARLCQRCIHKNFWKMTGTTLVLGWWGLISLIVTPFFLINNIARYLGSLSLPAVPPDAIATGHPLARPADGVESAVPIRRVPTQLPPRKRKDPLQ